MTKKELREKTNEELESLYNSFKRGAIDRLDNKLISMARDYLTEMQKIIDVQVENKIGR